jgi:HEAT repeat protein
MRGADAAGLLGEELAANDNARFASALGVARELPHEDITDVLVGQLPNLPPERQAMLLALIGDRGDVVARAAVLKAAESPRPQVRLAAIRALSTLGDASTMNVLLDAACHEDSELAVAALDSLAALPDPNVDVAVASRIDTAEGASRRVLVEVAGNRQIVAAVPSLLKAMDDADKKTQLAAIASLGKTIGPQQMDVLTERLLAPANEQEQKTVKESLKVACRRSADKKACAETLASCLTGAPRDVRFYLLELLGSVGGSTALEAVASAALSEDEQTQDVATRVLGQWLSPDAAPVLLEVAERSPYEKYQVRALRGAIRILRQMDIPDDSRITMCRQAMNLADRNQERILVLEALGRIPSVEALDLVMPQLQTESLKKAACSAAVSIAEKIAATQHAAVADAAKQILQSTDDNELTRRVQELLTRAEAEKE